MRFFILLFILVSSSINSARADLVHRPDGHAPIGVMADHGHKKGELMLSYRAMVMEMEDLLKGTNTLTYQDVFSSTAFMATPKKMTMRMHTLGGMYGITDKITLTLMVPYLSNKMTVARKMQSDEITMKSEGLGDVSVGSVYTLKETEAQRLVFSLGLSLPTGSVKESRAGMRLGYPMQIGSGSYALNPSMTYSRYWKLFSLGGQLASKLYLNENEENYRLGNRYSLNVWGAYNLNESLSGSLRFTQSSKDSISGMDSKINTMMSPTNRADFQGGHKGLGFIGINFLGRKILKGHRFAFEVGLPIYQDLKGPQMKTSFVGVLGWQKVY